MAIEVLIKDNHIIIAGELTSGHKPDYEKLVNLVFERIGKEKLDYGRAPGTEPDITVLVKEQSGDIALGVDSGGAGDQGISASNQHRKECCPCGCCGIVNDCCLPDTDVVAVPISVPSMRKCTVFCMLPTGVYGKMIGP